MSLVTLPQNTSVTIGTSTTDVIQFDWGELARTVILSNWSSNIIYVSVWDKTWSAAVVDRWIILPAGSGIAIDLHPESGKGKYINAIASGAWSKLGVCVIN